MQLFPPVRQLDVGKQISGRRRQQVEVEGTVRKAIDPLPRGEEEIFYRNGAGVLKLPEGVVKINSNLRFGQSENFRSIIDAVRQLGRWLRGEKISR